MKKIIAFLSLLIVVASCDKIEGPYISDPGSIPVDVEFPDLDVSRIYRKVLIEEYTGHRCSNCPNGHARLAELITRFGDTLVPVCLHAGSLARPTSEYPYDFRTETGNQLFNDFGMDPIPRAVINRARYQNRWDVRVDAWRNAIEEIDRSKKYAAIQMITQYKSNESTLYVYVKTTMLEQYSKPLLLSLFLVEDGIISAQLDHETLVPDYEHNHVLRLGINGHYGSQLTNDGTLAKDSAYQVGFPVRFAGTDWIAGNTTVVAILHDPDTREVLQTEMKKSVE